MNPFWKLWFREMRNHVHCKLGYHKWVGVTLCRTRLWDKCGHCGFIKELSK